MDEKELEELAIKELLQEAKRGKERSKSMGPSGWEKKFPSANKRFLSRTIVSSLYSRKRRKTNNNDLTKSDTCSSSSDQESSSRIAHDDKCSVEKSKHSKRDASLSKERLIERKKADNNLQNFNGNLKKKKLEKNSK